MRDEFEKVVDEMIAEQGEAWLGCPDFENRTDQSNAVIVANTPERCYRVFRYNGQWVKVIEPLDSEEMAGFFAEFGHHWRLTINSLVETSSGYCRIRAFIKNGRRKSGWSFSIDTKNTVPLAAGAKAA